MPGEETLLENVFKSWRRDITCGAGRKAVIRQYWDLLFPTSLRRTSRQAEGSCLASSRKPCAAHDRRRAGGVLLSGGVDSSGISAWRQGETDKKISTFTVGFSEKGIADERPYANGRDRFGSQHHEMTISAKDFADFLPKYVWHMEEPVCEPPAVALYYVSKLARNTSPC